MAHNSDRVTKTLANRLFQSFGEENCHEFTIAHIGVGNGGMAPRFYKFDSP